MSVPLLWDETPPLGIVRNSIPASGTECLPMSDEYCEAQAYINDAVTSFQYLRPALRIDTAALSLSSLERCANRLSDDFQRRQLNYICRFRRPMLGSDGSSPGTGICDLSDGILWDESSLAYPQTTSTCGNYTESDLFSSPASRQSSFSSFSASPEARLLDSATLQPPGADSSPLEDRWHFPTILDRFSALNPSSQRLFRNCGSEHFVQSAVMDILESPELQAKVAITWPMAEPLLEKVGYINITDGRGRRGAPQFYKCLWGSCGEKMSRKLHALEHIMNHVDNRSHICDHCGKGFVRKNELKKHSPCKALKRKLMCIDRGIVPTLPDTVAFQSPGPSYAEDEYYPPGLPTGIQHAQIDFFNTQSSAINSWETHATHDETSYFPYVQSYGSSQMQLTSSTLISEQEKREGF